jgi:hypothetical protein
MAALTNVGITLLYPSEQLRPPEGAVVTSKAVSFIVTSILMMAFW